MECCICKQEIPRVGDWDKGNDAWPVEDGRCCNECDALVVVPERLRARQWGLPENRFFPKEKSE